MINGLGAVRVQAGLRRRGGLPEDQKRAPWGDFFKLGVKRGSVGRCRGQCSRQGNPKYKRPSPEERASGAWSRDREMVGRLDLRKQVMGCFLMSTGW